MLKHEQKPPRGPREHSFFKRLFSSDQSNLNEDEKELKKLIPHYRGSVLINESKTNDLFWYISNFYIFEIIEYYCNA